MIIEVKARLSEGNVTAGDFVLNLTPTATFTDSQHQHCGLWQWYPLELHSIQPIQLNLAALGVYQIAFKCSSLLAIRHRQVT